MRKMKQILPLFLMVVLFVTSVLPVYATGTTSYDYNWEGQTEVAGNGITVDLNGSTTNSFAIGSEKDGKNNFVNLYYGEQKNINLRADISGVNPAEDMVFKVSLRRATTTEATNGNSATPRVQVRLRGLDAENETVIQTLVDVNNNYINAIGDEKKSNYLKFDGGKWQNLGFVLKADENKTLQLYVADELSYTTTYSKSFVWLTAIEILVTGSNTERNCFIDNIKGYNGDYSTKFESVASIGGVAYYNSFETALGAAKDNDVIKLEADATLPSTDYDKAITYDLNGHTLNADAFTGINATVVDSSNGNGLLKVPQNSLAFDGDNEGYMPVWDGTNYGYRFAKVTIEDRSVDATGNSLVFAMRPSFGSDTIGQLVAAGYEAGMVRVGVRITWTDPATNTTKTQDLPLNDSWLSTMYSNPSLPKGVKFTISGGVTITNFTATTIVWSNLSTCPNVEIAGETHVYSANVE